MHTVKIYYSPEKWYMGVFQFAFPPSPLEADNLYSGTMLLR